MEVLQILSHLDKEILYANLYGLKGDELGKRILKAQEEIIATKKTKYLLLVNLTDAYANEEVMKILRNENSKKLSQNAYKIAVIGIVGIKKILLNSINLFIQKKIVPFEDENSAKNYLISE